LEPEAERIKTLRVKRDLLEAKSGGNEKGQGLDGPIGSQRRPLLARAAVCKVAERRKRPGAAGGSQCTIAKTVATAHIAHLDDASVKACWGGYYSLLYYEILYFNYEILYFIVKLYLQCLCDTASPCACDGFYEVTPVQSFLPALEFVHFIAALTANYI
jgi:hypothetical protein